MQSSIYSGRSHFQQTNPAPSIIARRNKEYRFAKFNAGCYMVAVVVIVYAFVSLWYGGVFLKVWELLLRFHIGLDMWIGLVFIGSLPMTFVMIQVYKVFDEFCSIKGFRALYHTCHYIDPVQLMQCRLSYVIAAHPDRFSYAFASWAIVVRIRRKEALDSPGSIPSVEAEDFLFLDTVDDFKLIVASDTLESSESSAQLNAPEEQDTPSSSDTMIDINRPVTLEMKTEEIQPQLSESLAAVDKEIPVESLQVHATPEAIQEQFHVNISLQEIVRLFITENHANTASLKDSSEKRIAIPIKNVAHQALIAYLARDGKKWMDADIVMNRVYEYVGNKDKTQALFNTHVSRIRKSVREAIKAEFPEWASGAKDFDLFEQRMDGRDRSFWRLSENCMVAEMDALNTFYSHMSTIARSKIKRSRDTIEEKKLLRDAKRLIKRYSGNYLEKYPEDEEGYIGGYLIENLQELPFRSWALPFFKECRQKYIFCLEQAAKLEHLLWQEIKQPEYHNNAMRFYKECAYAATCVPIDSAQGEHALRILTEIT